MPAGTGPVAGVDIGGTKIAAGLVDATGTVTRPRSCPTPTGGAPAVLEATAALVSDLVAQCGARAVGVGAPGIVDPATGVVASASAVLPGWQGAAVREELAHRLGVPVAVDNDVRALAAGEARYGAGRGYRHVLYISVGTGLGGAITDDGQLVHGGHGSAGEIAHLLAPRHGRIACGCGRFDHLEALTCGPAIAAEYNARAGSGRVELPEIAERMRRGEERARTVITRAGTLLGRALAGLATALDFDAVVAGGGVTTIGAAFLRPLAAALTTEIRPPGRSIPVLAAALGTDAPLIGAALLATTQQHARMQEVKVSAL